MKQRPHLAPLIMMLLSMLSPRAQSNETHGEDDFHFRPFWVEPADRLDFGHGHLVIGIDHEIKPEAGAHRRTALPVEGTFGLGAGFSVMLGFEGGARTVFDNQLSNHSAGREFKLRYSLPSPDSLHLMLLTSTAWETGQGRTGHAAGYSLAWDIAPDLVVSAGQNWAQRHAGDPGRGREWGINIFRTGLGPDGRWALGGEWQNVRTADNQHSQLYLLGIGRVVAKGVMADLALGKAHGDASGKRITAGLSWFF